MFNCAPALIAALLAVRLAPIKLISAPELMLISPPLLAVRLEWLLVRV